MPGPSPDAPDHLRHLANIVHEWQEKLSSIDEEIANSPEGQVRRQREQQLEARRESLSTLGSQINGITLDGEAEEAIDRLNATVAKAAAVEQQVMQKAFLRKAGIKSEL